MSLVVDETPEKLLCEERKRSATSIERKLVEFESNHEKLESER